MQTNSKQNRWLRWSLFMALLLAVVWLGRAGITTAAGTGSGPGGVDSTDGAGNLRLWLMANQGAISPISNWTDQSGAGNHATQATAGNQPTLAANILNGQPVVRFDGVASPNNDYLGLPTLFNPTNANGYTLIAVTTLNNTANAYAIFQQRDTPGTGRTLLGTNNTPRVYSFLGGANRLSTSAIAASTPSLLMATWTGTTNGTHTHYRNGAADGSEVVATAESADGTWLLGVGKNLTNNIFPGDMAEVIAFNRILNAAERALVFNYLSAKYNIALTADEFYAGDTGGNGDFDFNVAGIGRNAGATSTLGFAAGFQAQNNSFLTDNGDFLMFGHDGTNNGSTASDVPTTGAWAAAPNPFRWLRSWYVDVTDANSNGGTVDITFDFSDTGMVSTPAGPASNYRLLWRATNAGQFTDVATAASVVGDQVVFTGVSAALLDGYVTLGSLDAAVSPTAVTLQTSQTASANPLLLVALAAVLVLATAVLMVRRPPAA